jgi:hypothetical protein
MTTHIFSLDWASRAGWAGLSCEGAHERIDARTDRIADARTDRIADARLTGFGFGFEAEQMAQVVLAAYQPDELLGCYARLRDFE